MIAARRHELILREVAVRGTVSVRDLADRLGVTDVTIRRDLTTLADQGRISRVHGGAGRPASGRPEPDRTGTSLVLGMVVPSSTYYFPSIIKGAEQAAAAAGARIVLAISHYDAKVERELLRRLSPLRFDGLLMTPTAAIGPDDATHAALRALGLPTVLVERVQTGSTVEGLFDSVRSDHTLGAMLAIEHLIGLGHQRIALALRSTTPTAPQIEDGYRRALSAAGLALPTPVTAVVPSDTHPRRSEQSMARTLRCWREAGVTAALIHSDADAAQAVQVAGAAGLRVPGELSIVAYDDEIAALSEVPLSAVAPPKNEVGQTAVQTLLRIVSGGAAPETLTRQVTLVPRFVTRSSTAAPSDR